MVFLTGTLVVAVLPHLIGGLLVDVLVLAVSALQFGAFYYIVDERSDGLVVSVLDSIRMAKSVIWRLIGYFILQCIGCFILLFLLFFGFQLSVNLILLFVLAMLSPIFLIFSSLAMPNLALGGTNVWQSFRNSFKMAAKTFWVLLGGLIIFNIPVVIGGVLNGVAAFESIMGSLGYGSGATGIGLLSIPLVIIAYILITATSGLVTCFLTTVYRSLPEPD